MKIVLNTVAASLCLLGAAPAQAAEVCESPTGGYVNSRCLQGNKICVKWTGATCVDGSLCKCGSDQCIIDGQCVDKGGCNSDSGGTCALQKCDSWRNATCSNEKAVGREAKCLCGPGTCPIKGECRVPGDCAKASGGTCGYLGCDQWRNAVCSVSGIGGPLEQAKCMCKPDACPINGECVTKGGCPRYTGDTCTFTDCKAGTCGPGHYCMCEPGQCFADGKCVDKTAANIELSLAWGAAQESDMKQDGVTKMTAALLGMAAAAMGISVVIGARARASSPLGGHYESMDMEK